MRKFLPALLLFCICSFSVYAQNNYSIKGVVADTSSRKKLARAAITIMNSKDSILYKFTRSGTDGSFSLNNLSQGNYLLLVTFHDYADIVRSFTLDPANTSHDFGQINMTLAATLLKEVVVRGQAITIRGDTTVFNASSYKVQPNARVEDLLVQMPGLQVDQDGKITAQGVAVGKVLVDGEEFFSSDPTLVTRNIRADMVKSIELYDKKSDQAKFTGADDPNKVKTLNVVLKEEARNSYFGKADVGQSVDYHQAQAMYNNFKPKKKWAVYGVLSNTVKSTGLSSQDNSKFGLSGNGSSSYGGMGVPVNKKAGFHYDTKYNKDKETVNFNYGFINTRIDAIVSTLIQNNLPGNPQLGTNKQDRTNTDGNHFFDASYVFNMNPKNSLRINASAVLTNNQSLDGNLATTSNSSNILLNRSNRTLNNDVDSKNISINAFFSRRLKKPGRSFSLNVSERYNVSDGNRFLYSANDFYNTTGGLDSTRIIDQYKPVDSKGSSFSSYFTWNEPVSKTLFLNLNYGLSLNNSLNNQQSYNKSSSGIYNIRDNVFSNNFDIDQLTHNAGFTLGYNKDKNSLNLGGSVSPVSFKQTDLDNNKIYKRHFLNFYQNASYTHRFTQSKSFTGFLYSSTSQPSIEQLQPIRVNTDPLNVFIGNPDLKPMITPYFRVNYLSTKQLTGQFFSVTAYGNLTIHPIINNIVTDAVGKTTTQYVNLSKSSDYIQFDVTLGNKLKKSGINISSNLNMTGQHNYNYINTILNTNTYYTFNFYSTFSKTVPKKYDFNLRTGPGFNLMASSLQKDRNNNNWVYRFEPTFNIYLPGKLQIGNTISYVYREKTEAFNSDYSALIWNTTLSKKFLKKENFILSLYGNDLFNQNVGFQRYSANPNYFTQLEYNTVRRYFMLQLTWDFTKPVPVPVKK